LTLFLESYARVMKTIQESQTFTEAFYSKLFAADERYRKLFENTDFRIQNNMLTIGLFQIYTYNMTNMAEYNLKQIGKAHGGWGYLMTILQSGVSVSSRLWLNMILNLMMK
jgi:hypothetical protein